MAELATKTTRALAKANKMADSCAIKFDVNSVVLPRGYSTENLRYARCRVNHSNDTITAHVWAELLVNCSAVQCQCSCVSAAVVTYLDHGQGEEF